MDTRMSQSAAEYLLRRDGWIVGAALLVIVLMAALYTVFGIGMQMTAVEMTQMARPVGHPMQMGAGPDWSFGYAALVFLMWAVMMVAMMTPSAAPAVLLFGALKRHGPAAGSTPDSATAHVLWFLGGYLAIWSLFSLIATLLQWVLGGAGVMAEPMMTLQSARIAGLVCLAAGLYQVTPAKQACLRHCQSPATFLTTHRKPGLSGAFVMGMQHGAYCTGCCWALMALLFVGGIMNLYWIVGIALYVALEKLAPPQWRIAYWSGLALCGFGLWLLVTG